MSTWIKRTAYVLLLLIAGVTFGVISAPAASADCGTPTSAPCTPEKPNPPRNLVATAPPTGTVILYWDAPTPKTSGSMVIGSPSGIQVFRGDEKIADLPSQGLGQATTYTDPNPPQGKDLVLTYTVRSINNDGTLSDPSNPATITPVQKAEVDPTLTAPGTATSGPDIANPDLAQGAAPTAFEAYGGTTMGDFSSSFASDSWMDDIKTFPVRVTWKIMVYLNYIALVFLAWTISPKMYQGVVTAIVAIVQGLFSMSIHDNLVQIAIAAGSISLIYLGIKKQWRNAGRGMVFILLGIMTNVIFMTYTSTVVTTIVTYPTKITSFVLGYSGYLANKITGTEVGNGRLGIKLVPGYPGVDPAYDGVRMFQEAEFINTEYAGKCRLNFGNLTWATQTPVPVRDDAPESFKNGMSFCEYLVKADHDHNQTEQEYLAKMVQTRAPPDVAAIFNGSDAASQYGIVFLLTLAVMFRTILLFFCAFVFAMVVLALGVMLVKAVVLVLAWYVPHLEPFMTRLARQIGIKFALSPLMAVSLIIGLLLTSVALTANGIIGWEMSMILQVVAGIVSLSVGWTVYKAQRDKSKAITAEREHQWDRYRTPEPELPAGQGSSGALSGGAQYAIDPPGSSVAALSAPSPAAIVGTPQSTEQPQRSLIRTAAITAVSGGTAAAVDVVANAGKQQVGRAAHAATAWGHQKWHNVEGAVRRDPERYSAFATPVGPDPQLPTEDFNPRPSAEERGY